MPSSVFDIEDRILVITIKFYLEKECIARSPNLAEEIRHGMPREIVVKTGL